MKSIKLFICLVGIFILLQACDKGTSTNSAIIEPNVDSVNKFDPIAYLDDLKLDKYNQTKLDSILDRKLDLVRDSYFKDNDRNVALNLLLLEYVRRLPIQYINGYIPKFISRIDNDGIKPYYSIFLDLQMRNFWFMRHSKKGYYKELSLVADCTLVDVFDKSKLVLFRDREKFDQYYYVSEKVATTLVTYTSSPLLEIYSRDWEFGIDIGPKNFLPLVGMQLECSQSGLSDCEQTINGEPQLINGDLIVSCANMPAIIDIISIGSETRVQNNCNSTSSDNEDDGGGGGGGGGLAGRLDSSTCMELIPNWQEGDALSKARDLGAFINCTSGCQYSEAGIGCGGLCIGIVASVIGAAVYDFLKNVYGEESPSSDGESSAGGGDGSSSDLEFPADYDRTTNEDGSNTFTACSESYCETREFDENENETRTRTTLGGTLMSKTYYNKERGVATKIEQDAAGNQYIRSQEIYPDGRIKRNSRVRRRRLSEDEKIDSNTSGEEMDRREQESYEEQQQEDSEEEENTSSSDDSTDDTTTDDDTTAPDQEETRPSDDDCENLCNKRLLGLPDPKDSGNIDPLPTDTENGIDLEAFMECLNSGSWSQRECDPRMTCVDFYTENDCCSSEAYGSEFGHGLDCGLIECPENSQCVNGLCFPIGGQGDGLVPRVDHPLSQYLFRR